MTQTHKPQPNSTQQVKKHTSYFSNPSLDHMVAGLTAGATSTLLLHPADIIKTRLQTQSKHDPLHQQNNSAQSANVGRVQPNNYYNNSFDAFKKIRLNEGYHAFYKGLIPNLVGNATSWGFYFFFYNSAKNYIAQQKQHNKSDQQNSSIQSNNFQTQLSSIDHMLAASLAGSTVLTITNPIWVVKTRMILNYDKVTNNSNSIKNHGLVSNLSSLYKQEGLKGFYRGYAAGLFGVSHGAVQFVTYEKMKEMLIKRKIKQDEHKNKSNKSLSVQDFVPVWSPIETMSMAIISKVFASMATYPYQVVRSRLQSQHTQYKSTMDCIQTTFNKDGIRGFYRGATINTIKVLPATTCVFVVYEQVHQALSRMAPQNQTPDNNKQNKNINH